MEILKIVVLSTMHGNLILEQIVWPAQDMSSVLKAHCKIQFSICDEFNCWPQSWKRSAKRMLDIQTLKIKITHYYPAHPDVEKQSGWVAAISPQGLAHTGHCLNLLADYWEDGGSSPSSSSSSPSSPSSPSSSLPIRQIKAKLKKNGTLLSGAGNQLADFDAW